MATPPSDQSSLLVPLNLDAWVVTSQNTKGLAWYFANYQNLKQFKSPFPEPFISAPAEPAVGVHLHWALPDALTHGREGSTGTTSADLAGSVRSIPLEAPGAAGAVAVGTRLTVLTPD